MRIGVTGHQELDDPSAWRWVEERMLQAINAHTPVIGVSLLAAGADQLFASCVLRSGGSLEAIIPFDGYESILSIGDRQRFRQLVELASAVEVLPGQESPQEAYLVAGMRLVDRVELLLAVWDGEPAAGIGGTADIVEYARQRACEVLHFNPVTFEVTVRFA